MHTCKPLVAIKALTRSHSCQAVVLLGRNIFEGKKYVEEYRVQDVESELGMTRDKLIQLALLLGSDYTEGVAGIGIVNAVEIVNAFPSEELLINFRYRPDTRDCPQLCGMVCSVWGKRQNRLHGGRHQAVLDATTHAGHLGYQGSSVLELKSSQGHRYC